MGISCLRKSVLRDCRCRHSDLMPDKFVAEAVRNIPPSGIRKFFDLVLEMEGVISWVSGSLISSPLAYQGGVHIFSEKGSHPILLILAS